MKHISVAIKTTFSNLNCLFKNEYKITKVHFIFETNNHVMII